MEDELWEDSNELAVDANDLNYLNISEEDLANILKQQIPLREEVHGQLAIEIARQARIFPSTEHNWSIRSGNEAHNASGDDIRKLLEWKTKMHQDVLTQNQDDESYAEDDAVNSTSGVEHLLPSDSSASHESNRGAVLMLAPEKPLSPMSPADLNEAQLRAYNIIVDHLHETLAGRDPQPLRMILYGEGGTGKSKVIQTVSDAFERAGMWNFMRSLRKSHTMN